MNKSDSERLIRVIDEMGFEWTDKEDEADLLGLVACSVRQKAIDKVYTKIHKWNTQKSKRNLITFVSGCVLPDDRDKFLKLFDLVFQMSEVTQFPAMLSQYGVTTPFRMQMDNELDLPEENVAENEANFDFSTVSFDHKTSITGKPVLMNKPDERIESFWDIKPTYNSDFEAFVPIQNGCDKFCTYCAVPFTRGREISRPSDEIVTEVKRLVDEGYKSITLLGQNVNSYGVDKKGEEITFAELLRAIGKMGDESGKYFWLYFTSPHPQDMGDDVIEAIAAHKCLAKQIHIPMQSGDDKMLIHMNRSHNMNDYRKIIHSIRRLLPTATIFTDIIVGFTGETDEQYENTVKAMDEFKFNMAYIARYSPRPGARSARWADDVAHAIKKHRLHDLSAKLASISREYNESLIDSEQKILVVQKDRKGRHMSGINEGKIIVRFASTDESLIGKFVKVKITSVVDFATEGDLIKIYEEENVQA